MPSPTRRNALAALAGFGLAGAAGPLFIPSRSRAENRLDTLTLAGMPATPSVVLARLVASGALAAHVDHPALAIWRTPDQMRAGVVSGAMAVFATPSYACANLRNRGVPVRQLDILTWGLLTLMSRDGAVRRLEDVAGRTVLVGFRHDAPDLIVRLLLRRLGMAPDRDVTLEYAGSSAEAAQLFLAGRSDLAILPEPAASAVEMRAAATGLEVFRAVDLTEVWGRLTGSPPRIPQAGLGVRDDFLQARPELCGAIHDGCIAAARWVLEHPDEAGRLGAAALDLPAAIVSRSLPHLRLDVVSAAAARPDLERYFAALMEMSPDILGGRLPDDAFYWGPA